MKRKVIITAAVICILIFCAILVARLTGVLQWYTIPTPSNEPTIKKGDLVYTSNRKAPQPYSFIVFTSDRADSLNMSIPGFKTASHYLYRLCGLPGNIIEMKNGVLYVDNKNFDRGLNLNNQYKISDTAFFSMDQDDINNLETSGGVQQMGPGSYTLVTFDSAMVAKYQSRIKLVPYIITDENLFDCFRWNGKNTTWTVDNFGPLKIPADCYFALGDNRHNALDSRYIGFVKKENIISVALNK